MGKGLEESSGLGGGSERSHREQIGGLRGTDRDKRMKPGFRGLENLEQKPGWGSDRGLGNRNRHGRAKVSFGEKTETETIPGE